MKQDKADETLYEFVLSSSEEKPFRFGGTLLPAEGGRIRNYRQTKALRGVGTLSTISERYDWLKRLGYEPRLSYQLHRNPYSHTEEVFA